jgi:hypothetical protein
MSQPQRGLTEETIVYLDDKIKTGKDWPSFSVDEFITAFPQYRETLEKHKGGPLNCLKEKYKHILNVRKQKAATTTSSLATPSGNTAGNWHKQPILQGSDRGLQTGNLYMSGSQAPHVGGWSSGPPHTPGTTLPPGLMAGIWPGYSPTSRYAPGLYSRPPGVHLHNLSQPIQQRDTAGISYSGTPSSVPPPSIATTPAAITQDQPRNNQVIYKVQNMFTFLHACCFPD